MIVELYGLKCFALGSFVSLFIYRSWIEANKFRSYEIKDFKKWKDRP